MTTDITKRVARGVKWLDRHAPGWEKRVKLREFNIKNGCKCVLGQVFADTHMSYTYLMKERGFKGVISTRYAAACGFHVPDSFTSEKVLPYYSQLQREWKRVIRERKGGTR